MPEPLRSTKLAILEQAAPCDTCRWRGVCGSLGLACRRFREYSKGASECRWRLEPNEPRADIGEDLGLLKITDEQLAELIDEHGAHGAASVLKYSYHRLRKRMGASAVLRTRKRSSVSVLTA